MNKIAKICLMILLAVLLAELWAVWERYARTIDRAAPSTLCRQNLRQLYSVFQLYLKDHQGRFPESWKTDDTAWVGGLKPYLSPALNEVFRCPTETDPGKFYTYRFNPELAGKKVAELAHPEALPLLSETGFPHHDHSISFCLLLNGEIKTIIKGRE